MLHFQETVSFCEVASCPRNMSYVGLGSSPYLFVSKNLLNTQIGSLPAITSKSSIGSCAACTIKICFVVQRMRHMYVMRCTGRGALRSKGASLVTMYPQMDWPRSAHTYIYPTRPQPMTHETCKEFVRFTVYTVSTTSEMCIKLTDSRWCAKFVHEIPAISGHTMTYAVMYYWFRSKWWCV